MTIEYTISQEPPTPAADPVSTLRQIWTGLSDEQKMRLAQLGQSKGVDLGSVFTRSADLATRPALAPCQKLIAIARAIDLA